MPIQTKVFSISIDKRFHLELTDLPKHIQGKIIRCVDNLRNSPWNEAKQLKGVDGIWRQKVDAYRILYAIGDSWVHVYSVQHRQGVYAGTIAKPISVPTLPSEPFPLLETLDSAYSAKVQKTANINDQKTITKNLLINQGLGEDLVNKILIAKKPEDLEELIDLGIPEALFDQLWELLRKNREGSEKKILREGVNLQVQLIRRDVIDHFFGRLIRLPLKAKIYDLTIVSPWITPWSGKYSSLMSVVKYANISHSKVTIITRKPEIPNHISAMSEIEKIKNLEIVYLPGLHAKYFICDVAPIPFALLGSANVTEQSLANFEIGVLVRGSGDAESFIRELQSLTIELRSIGEVKRRKML